MTVCRSIVEYVKCLKVRLDDKCPRNTAIFQMNATVEMMKSTHIVTHCTELNDPKLVNVCLQTLSSLCICRPTCTYMYH